MLVINMNKAKEIAHDIRRKARQEEFAPLDEAITINIVNSTAVAELEEQRQVVKNKYATIQTNIDNSTDVTALKTIVEGLV